MQITVKEKRQINKEFREIDESNLWPIRGRFNVTERAIRKARQLMACNGEFSSPYHYRAVLEAFMSEIVNNPKNH
jgi:hypothetical protein